MPDPASPATEAQHPQIDGIRILPGTTNVLIVAPHGAFQTLKSGKRKYRNDEKTGIIAEAIHKHKDAGWFTVINDDFIKPDEDENEEPDFRAKRLDLYKIEQAELVPGYLEAIKGAVDANKGKTLVVWIHGMGDGSATTETGKHIKAKKSKKKDGDLHALIGYGQGKHPRIGELKASKKAKPEDSKDRHTADTATIERFRKELTARGIHTLIARDDASNYRGRDPERLNQWFLNQDYKPEQVESFQIEIREKDFRENEAQCVETAKKLVEALRTIAPPVFSEALVPDGIDNVKDDELAEQAYQHLQQLFVKHITGFMVEAGGYIIDTFYGGDAYLALAKNKSLDKPASLKQLIKKLKAEQDGKSGNTPSVSWFYKSVSLAAHERICADLGLSTFTILGHSHKLLLLNYPKMKGIKGDKYKETIEFAFRKKDDVAKDAFEKDGTASKLSVRQFAGLIQQKQGKKKKPRISAGKVPADPALEQEEMAVLKRLNGELNWYIAQYEKKLSQYQAERERVAQVIKRKPEDKRKPRKVGFRDWTDPACNVNIQTGCANDCRYCYAKTLAYKREQKELGSWADQEIRPQDVDKHRHLYHGLVGFPSTHDIRPENLGDYLHVLGKLLRAGNEVLIVSKPRPECIRRICEASSFFKDKILFRFTIGAMDNALLEFWEPNAPTYEERKDALKFAYDQSFRTSVSIEPMLDAGNVVAMVNDLAPLVSEDIWIGKMNHTNEFGKGADEELREHLAQVEAGQTDERLTALHKAFEGRDNVKWKTGSRPEDIVKEAPPAP